MDKIIISADDLSVGYGKNPVVSGIKFEIRQGEILTLIGPNGAGKSTILKTLAKYLKKLGGNVSVGEKNADSITDSEMSRLLSVVLTERIRPDLMSCREVVETGRYPYTGKFGFLSAKDKECVDMAVKTVAMEEFEHKDFNSVSDGQRQRVMLARAICQEPEILILDEPTSYLDIHHKIAFLEILRKLADEKRIAVIVSMHELDFAEKISNHTLCVKDGRIAGAGKPQEIFTDDNLCSLYDIPKELFLKYFG